MAKGRSSSDDKRRRARREMDNAATGLSSAQLVGGAGDPFPRVIWRNSRKHRGRRSFTDNELAAIFDDFLFVRKPLRNHTGPYFPNILITKIQFQIIVFLGSKIRPYIYNFIKKRNSLKIFGQKMKF